MSFLKTWCLTISLSLMAFHLTGCGSSDPQATDAQATNSADTTQPESGTSQTGSPTSTSQQANNAAAENKYLHPVVELKTNQGIVKVKLNREAAPETVDNFLQYVADGHYDGTIFHQAISNYAILGGTYDAQNNEKPVRTPIRNEATNGLKNLRGTIAMSRSHDVINSANSQFFINIKDNPKLDHKNRDADGFGYCVFGEVIEGMEVVDAISKTPVTDEESARPVKTVLIETVRQL